MKPFVLSLSIVGIVLAVALGISCSKSPASSAVTIVDGRDTPDATQYAEEFVESLQVSTHWNTGAPLSEPYFYFSNVYGELKSPNGVFALSQHKLQDDYHEITLSRPGGQAPESVLVIQECDRGSGTSHAYQWSRDSKAIFIYGCGKPAGYPHNQKLALVYLVERRTLYTIDISPFLPNRLKRTRENASNHALQPAEARLTTAEAIRIAQGAAERDGRKLADYKQPEAHYEFTRKDKSWWVFFDGKVPMPGNHFSVTIDDQTGKTQLMPGQ